MDLLKRMNDIQKMFNKDYILENLNKDICTVVFLKVDGTKRYMNATLNKKIISDIVGYDISDTKKDTDVSIESDKKTPISQDLVKLFDVDAKGWRSFKISRMQSFEIKGSK